MKASLWTRTLVTCLSLATAVPAPSRAASPKPNVITFLLDDLDMDSFNALVAQGKLPNINKSFIKGGVRFENSFVANAVCAPSRATMLTGQYSKNNGVLNLSPGYPGSWLQPTSTTESKTLPVALQKQGYRTGHVGKYLNGYEQTDSAFVPPGYDTWVGLRGTKAYQMYGYQVSVNGNVKTYESAVPDYQTDVLAGYASDFVQSADPRPFSLIVTPIPPHLEVFPVKEVVKIATGASKFSSSVRPAPRHVGRENFMPEPGSFSKPSFGEYPGIDQKNLHVSLSDPLTEEDADAASLQYRQRLASMLAVDELVGRVVTALGTKAANTILVFSSDNGYFFGEHRLTSKLMPYEESIRVPLFLAGPGIAKGLTSKAVALNTDIAPTIAELTGTPLLLVPDGRSLAANARNPLDVQSRRQFLVEHYEDMPLPAELVTLNSTFEALYKANQIFTYKAMRRIDAGENLLYVQWYEDLKDKGIITHRELYDITADPSQCRNLAIESAYAGKLQELSSALAQLVACAGTSCREAEDKK